MATTTAVHMRNYRRRKKAGKIVLAIEIDEEALAVALITAQMIPDRFSRKEISKATARLLQALGDSR